MSRGGRGGGGFRGGGRGGFGGGKQRIGGQEVSWDFDPDLVIETKPQEMFPDIEFSNVRPAGHSERSAVRKYCAIRRRINEGSFYTVLGDNVRVNKAASKRAAEFNPFEDMPTYTQKYKQPSKKLPRFDTRKYQLQFFPQELWGTIDPTTLGDTPETTRPKRMTVAQVSKLDDLDEEKERAEDEDDAPKLDEDEEPEEENLDENFSEDDDDMGEDYDAEKYFDAGEDDAGDALDGDGGGDDGGDY